MKKSSNIIFILIFLIFTFSVLILNLIIKPIDVNLTDMNDISIPRDILYTIINAGREEEYDSVVIGGSGVTSAISIPENVMCINPQGIAPIELFDLLKYFLSLHPEVKNIYVSLEFNTYFTCFNKYTIPRKPTNVFQDFIKLYFSFDAIYGSCELLYVSLFKHKDRRKYNILNYNRDANGKIFFVSLPTMKIEYHNSICDFDNISVFKKIYNLINEKNLNAFYFIPPVHALYLSDAVSGNYFKNIERYKREIAKITPYYDMSFVNYYTTLPIGYLFFDVYHINGAFVSKKTLNTIYGIEKDDSYVFYITKDNVDEILKKQNMLLMDYIKNNKDIVEYRRNHVFDGKEKKTYLEDFPKNLQELFYENHKYIYDYINYKADRLQT